MNDVFHPGSLHTARDGSSEEEKAKGIEPRLSIEYFVPSIRLRNVSLYQKYYMADNHLKSSRALVHSLGGA
jgi:hypothetical protein